MLKILCSIRPEAKKPTITTGIVAKINKRASLLSLTSNSSFMKKDLVIFVKSERKKNITATSVPA